MKKTAPNLYEVLRTTLEQAPARRTPPRRVASRRPEPEAPAAEPAATAVALEEPPEESCAPPPEPAQAPPAPELAAAAEPQAEAELAQTPPEPWAPEAEAPEAEAPPPVEEPVEPAAVFAPISPAAPEPAPATPPRAVPLGERRITLSYNTLLFAGLVLLIAFFAAYSAGFQRGRAAADAAPAPEAAPEPAVEPAPAPPWPPPAAPAALYRIEVLYWSMPNASERRIARANADRVVEALRQAGFPNVETVEEPTRGGPPALRLYVGRFADRSSPEATETLERIRQLPYNGQRLFSRAGLVRPGEPR